MSQEVYQPSDLPSRMADKIEVDSESGCWSWTGSCNRQGPSGYGTVSQAEPRGPNHTMLQPASPGSRDEGGSSSAPGLGEGTRPQDPLSTR